MPLFVYANDMDKCNREHEPNRKNMCMAVATLSVSYCEKLTNADLKSTCVFQIRDRQRKVNSFHPMKDRKEITKE